MFTFDTPAMQLAAAFSWFSSPQAKVLYSRTAKYSKLTLIGIAQYSLVIISLTALLVAYAYNELTGRLVAHCTQSEPQVSVSSCETHETHSETQNETVDDEHPVAPVLLDSFQSMEEYFGYPEDDLTQEQEDALDEFCTYYINICEDYDSVHDLAGLEDLAIANLSAPEKPLTKREMLSICKSQGVKGYSKLNAEALTQKLAALDLYHRRFIPIE